MCEKYQSEKLTYAKICMMLLSFARQIKIYKVLSSVQNICNTKIVAQVLGAIFVQVLPRVKPVGIDLITGINIELYFGI